MIALAAVCVMADGRRNEACPSRHNTCRSSPLALIGGGKIQSSFCAGLEDAGFSKSHMSDTYGLLPTSRMPSSSFFCLLDLSMPASRTWTINVFSVHQPRDL